MQGSTLLTPLTSSTHPPTRYSLAESLDSQLTSLSANLSSMIIDINTSLSSSSSTTTTAVSKPRPGTSTDLASIPGVGAGAGGDEDAVQQILTILNAHLNSLRWIDGAVKALRGRIAGLRRGRVE